MPKNYMAIPISTEAVGLAFQQQLGAVPSITAKRAKKSEFTRLRRTLIDLRLFDNTAMELTHIAWGVTCNGDEVILACGRPRES